jgi:RNA polymerase sigma factor (sigma-70 family)
LIALARAGDSHALNALLTRQKASLKTWARGRLPQWARRAVDTNDLIQEALLQTLRHIHTFDDRGRGALQAYLREAVRNRIRDELRRVSRRPVHEALDEAMRDHGGASPFDAAAEEERMRRYKTSLALLTDNERMLVVGRMEMSYTYEQLALATGRSTAEAARVAVRRAVLKLAVKMAE